MSTYKTVLQEFKPTLWWKLNETTLTNGSTIVDTEAKQNGEVKGTLTSVKGPFPNPSDSQKAIYFNKNAANYIKIGTAGTTVPQIGFAGNVEAWVYLLEAGQTAGIFEKSVAEAHNSSYVLGLTAGKPYITEKHSTLGVQTITSATSLEAEKWYQILWNRGTTESSLWVNAVEVGTKLENIAEKNVAGGAGTSYIGIYAGLTSPFNGYIASVTHGSLELSGSNIKSRYKAGSEAIYSRKFKLNAEIPNITQAVVACPTGKVHDHVEKGGSTSVAVTYASNEEASCNVLRYHNTIEGKNTFVET